MKKKEVQRIIVHRDNQKIDALKLGLQQTLQVLQNLVNVYRKSPLDQDATLYDLVFKSHVLEEKYINDIIEGTNMFEGLPIKLKPNSFESSLDASLRNASKEAKSKIEQNKVDIKFFSLVDDKVSIKQEMIDSYIEQNTVWADTPETIELFSQWLELGQKLNSFDELLRAKHKSYLMAKPLNPIYIARYFRLNHENKLIPRIDIFNLLKKKGDIKAFFEN